MTGAGDRRPPGRASSWSVADVIAGVRSGRPTATEVTETVLDRISAAQPLHNAFITVDAEGARRQAESVDRRIAAGEEVGPLAGVPVAVKDVFDVAGLPTTSGSALLAGDVATSDGPETAALRRAGAVVVGKTNMDEFAFGPNQNAFGRTNCPADPARYAGGSSAGSAAAVAAGTVPIALGSDAGGSVRYPAACCGVVGYKPTFGLFPFQGRIPRLASLDHIGLLASRVEDVVALAAALPGGPHPVPGPRAALRFGVPRGWADLCSAEVAVAVRAALAAVEAAGAVLVEVPPMDEQAVFTALLTIVCTEAAASLDELIPADRQTEISAPVRTLLDRGRATGATEYQRAQGYRRRLRKEIDRSLSDVDALLTPTTATVAKRWDEPDLHDWSIARFLPAFNLTGHPAVSVPVAADGLPVGVQVVAPHGQDGTLLSIAAWVERHSGRAARMINPQGR